MLGEIIGEVIGRLVIEFAFGILFYYLGKLLVSVFTLGTIRCDPLGDDSWKKNSRWVPMYQKRGDQIYLTGETVIGIGLLTVILPEVLHFLLKD